MSGQLPKVENVRFKRYFFVVPDGLIEHYDVPNNPPIPAIPPRAPRGSMVSFNSRQKVRLAEWPNSGLHSN